MLPPHTHGRFSLPCLVLELRLGRADLCTFAVWDGWGRFVAQGLEAHIGGLGNNGKHNILNVYELK